MATNRGVHAYLLYGPSGLGKTTIARIIATKLDAELIEIDAATYSGVDQMRALSETGRHMSLKGKGVRMFLLNEVQRLSKGAWDALLTILEEPPAHLYFALTTTEFDKIPSAVITRSFKIKLESLHPKYIETLLEKVIEAEGWKVRDDVFNEILRASAGSPRQALSLLQSCWGSKSVEDMSRVVSLESKPLNDMLKFLLEGKAGWEPIRRALSSMSDDAFENAIIQAGRYLGAVLIKTEDPRKAERIWLLIEALVHPTSTYDRKIAFYAACGRFVNWRSKDA
jgi:DNA polymerase-3 subunit gamma/tau